VRPTFTLNMGLRYQYQGAPDSLNKLAIVKVEKGDNPGAINHLGWRVFGRLAISRAEWQGFYR